MTEAIINEEALEHVVQKLDSFVWTDKDKEERDNLRQHFQETYDKQRIDSLTREDYFAGLGKKQGCLAYDLEWGTRPLGSIKGGSKLLIGGLDTENTGLELYLEYNFKLLKVKKRIEEITGKTLGNFEFARLLYHAFPKEHDEVPTDGQPIKPDTPQEEQKFEALEVQHYQTLLHRNMPRLFPKLKYFDEEEHVSFPKNSTF